MNADEQAIRELVAHWHAATAAGDVDAVLRLMADDVVFLVAGHPPMRGKAAFEKGLRNLLVTQRIDSSSQVEEVEVSGKMAYCRSELRVSIAPRAGGAAVVRSGSALSILRKQADGSWVVVRDANLLAASV